FLLVGGEALALWELPQIFDQDHQEMDGDKIKWTKIWEQKVASKVILAQFSPDSTMFATMGEVWWNPQNSEAKERRFNFNYLPHPRAVVNLAWREGPAEQKKSNGSNILLTMCRDEICRIWVPTNPEEPHNLYITTVVDPDQSLVTHQLSEEERIDPEDSDYFTPIHWIHPKEFLTSLKMSIEVFDGEIDQAVLGSGLRKLKNLASDTSDLFYQIQRDGSMSALLENMDFNSFTNIRISIVGHAASPKYSCYYALHKRFPCRRWIIFAKVLPPFMIISLPISRNVRTNLAINKRLLYQASVELAIVAQSPQGRIKKYVVRLVEIFDSLQSVTALELKHSWTGHRSDVRSMVRAPGVDSFVSLEKDGDATLWDISTPESYQCDKRTGPTIIERSSISTNSQIRLACVLPNGRFLAAYNGIQVALFSCEDDHSHQIS
ncbi:12619_t:CDS:2, partial [Acaulospora colombiana]